MLVDFRPPGMVARHGLLSSLWTELLWRFKNADNKAVVNSNYNSLSIATSQNPAPEAIVYPLKVRAGKKPVLEEPITFFEMYKRKMSKDLELARLKKLVKEKQLNQKTNVKPESVEEIFVVY
ncbi:Naringenin [Abeliophyllum distichum]|uniref:Naringenin n=1 Tax=Abeliophyllum distichum TaxID=126358 RepID=A0ABD1QU83_9LAMI